MEPLQLYMRHRKTVARSLYVGAALFVIQRMTAQHTSPKKSSRKPKVAIDRTFLKNLWRVIRIIMPGGVRSREFWFLTAESLFLMLRTALSLYIARLDGRIVSHLVKGQGREFALSLVLWMLVGLPASFTNAILRYLQRIIALRFRMRLNEHLLQKYLPQSGNPVYYSLFNLDDRVKNADQVMTADISRFSTAISGLYANLSKPTLDMCLYTWQLSKSIGGDNVFFISLAIHISAYMLRLAAPPFGEFVAEEASLEGAFRTKHRHLLENAEEIALYGGHKTEKDVLDRSYYALFKHSNRVLRRKLYYHFAESFVIKYYWGALGLVLCSVPVFLKSSVSSTSGAVGRRTESFVTNRRLLISGSDAFGRIMSSYKEISQLAGYTARVSNYLDVMEDMTQGKFEKQLIAPTAGSQGSVRLGEDIIFEDIPIVSPVGDVLVEKLSFHVKHGQHLLIVGPNGCGKSSLFRILGGLWEIKSGTLTRPRPHEDIFYIPQRPYLSKGTLRQQIIYPTTEENNTVDDAELLEILNVLELDGLVESVGGWDTEREWREDLSTGVQQRIAAARLFYHKPKFAILDECTSSVTVDVETIIYTHAKDLGISLLTVSHRASLWKYHNLILQFDGFGGYIFTDLDAEKRLKLEEEKLSLDQELRREEDIRERLQVLLQSLDN